MAGVGDARRDLHVPLRVLVLQRTRPEPEKSAGETREMIHLVLQPVELQVRHVSQAAGALPHHVVHDGRHRLVVHLARLIVRLAGLQPRFEEVFVEAVAQCAQRHVFCNESISNSRWNTLKHSRCPHLPVLGFR